MPGYVNYGKTIVEKLTFFKKNKKLEIYNHIGSKTLNHGKIKLCRLWFGYVNYCLLKISPFKIEREFMYVMYNFYNQLILKNKRLYCPKNFGQAKNF